MWTEYHLHQLELAVNSLRWELKAGLQAILRRLDTVDPALQKLQDDVRACTTVMQGAKTLLAGLSQQLKDLVTNATDLAALRAGVTGLATDLETGTADLSQAIIDSTPTPPVN